MRTRRQFLHLAAVAFPNARATADAAKVSVVGRTQYSSRSSANLILRRRMIGDVRAHHRVARLSTPPSLGAIARAEGLTNQTVFRLKKDPLAALAAWDM
jgi:hypothetical protein